MIRRIRWTLVSVLLLPMPAAAQVDGSVSALFDVLPDLEEAPGRQTTGELRLRLFAERQQDIGKRWHVAAGVFVDALAAGRAGAVAGGGRDAIVRPADVFVEYRAPRFDVRAGFSRVVWGRLDEFQPTDVINPIDLSRFLLEGRSEARLPVALVRGRWFAGETVTVEGVIVPAFRRGRFDQLDEAASPFNLLRGLPVERRTPGIEARNLQGGGRLAATSGRVDWSLSAYRGLKAFPLLEAGERGIHERFPRFTMLGADIETARGAWGVRGEVAVTVDDTLQASVVPRVVEGRSVEAGVGIDRRAGDYRVAFNAVATHRRIDDDAPGAALLADDPELRGTDLLLVASAERTFARETWRMRLLGVHDPTDDTGFLRVIAATSLRDNVWLETSGGLFAGASADTIGRLTRRDFLYARLKVYF